MLPTVQHPSATLNSTRFLLLLTANQPAGGKGGMSSLDSTHSLMDQSNLSDSNETVYVADSPQLDVLNDRADASVSARLVRQPQGGALLRSPGRKPPKLTRELIQELHDKYPPDTITELIDETLAYARYHKSGKLILATVELLLNYQIGKPVARRIQATVKWSEMLAELDKLGDSDESGQLGQVIDGEAEAG